MNKISERTRMIGGTVFAGCLFLGLGVGWLYGNLVIGIMIGMGVGFLAMAAVFAFSSDRDESSSD